MHRKYLSVLIFYFINGVYSKAIPEGNETVVEQEYGGRIVGGVRTEIKYFPFLISLFRKYDGLHLCGGSILGDYWIMTAAHCMLHDITYYRIRIGSTDSRQGGVIFNLGEIHRHPNYSKVVKYDSDIALLKLNTPITVDTKGSILNISSSVAPLNSRVTVAGWGQTNNINEPRYYLRCVDVFITDWAQCKRNYTDKKMTVTNNMVCAGYPGGTKDSCSGDSGGPLLYKGQAVGIVSFGYDCALEKYPGVYTKIINFIPWIRDVTGLPV